MYNPRNTGYILQHQTLGWGGFQPPYEQRLPAVLGILFYTILEIYINEEGHLEHSELEAVKYG